LTVSADAENGRLPLGCLLLQVKSDVVRLFKNFQALGEYVQNIFDSSSKLFHRSVLLFLGNLHFFIFPIE
jgi:hypothetical protein